MFSIIISTKGRQRLFENTLNAAIIAANGNGEILVINDDLEKLEIKNDYPVKVYETGGKGVSYARNLGAKLAKSELLIFIDNDILINAENIRRILEVYAFYPTALINPVWEHPQEIEEIKTTSLLGRFMAKYYHNDSFKSRYLINNSNIWIENEVFQSQNKGFSECCFFISKQNFTKAGGFNETYKFGNEGLEFSVRLNNVGIKIFVDPLNKVIHNELDRYLDYRFFIERKEYDARSFNRGELGNVKMNNNVNMFFYSALSNIKFLFEFLIKLIPNIRIMDPIYSKTVLILAQIRFYSTIKKKQ